MSKETTLYEVVPDSQVPVEDYNRPKDWGTTVINGKLLFLRPYTPAPDSQRVTLQDVENAYVAAWAETRKEPLSVLLKDYMSRLAALSASRLEREKMDVDRELQSYGYDPNELAAKSKVLINLLKEKQELLSECDRLAKVAEHWQQEYYKLNPQQYPGKIDNL